MAVSVVAGLGNPGAAYEGTRHNAGFVLVDALAAELGCSWARDRKGEALYAVHQWHGRRLFLVKSQTYVNRSGSSLQAFCGYYKIPAPELVVAYDEVNLPTGRAKISIGGSAGGHNGVADILTFFPNEFVRFRLGVGPKSPPQMALKDFVLGRFSESEATLFSRNIKSFLDGMKLLIDSGVQPAMNRVNQRPRENPELKQPTSTHGVQETENDNSRD